MPSSDRTLHLRAGEVSVVLHVPDAGPPALLHWGRDLGALDDEVIDALVRSAVPPVPHSALDEPWWLTLLPGEADGWSGHPAVSGHVGGRALHPRWRTAGLACSAEESGAQAVEVVCRDDDLQLTVTSALRLEPQGVLRARHTLERDPEASVDVLDLDALEVLLPVPERATEVLDLTGRWCRERTPQRGPLPRGTHLRESRRGRTGHDAPLVLSVGTPGFGFRSGEVWGVHVAWSGDHVHLAQRLPEGAGQAAGVLGGGELLRPGEVRLPPGGSYTTPWLVATWSGEGLDGAAQRLHRWLRARPRHASSPRPLVLNTWEAVYFQHDLDRLRHLADVAADVGVERFVLDDGWFRGRRGDTAGLGDWHVDPAVWPDGLHPLVNHVRALGMQVGLWVEPEMVNLDSDLARDHPDWLLAPAGRTPRPWRHQHVLDLGRAEVRQHLVERLSALVQEYGLDFLKWDHNRDVHEGVHGATGAPGVRGQTLGAYAVLDELRSRHPHLEIESCASGGARVDLGILERTDRVWASDTNDALERQAIQRWTGQLLPPELVGSHVGPPVAHTTGRTGQLAFRCLAALFGHGGIEWDLTAATDEELAVLARWSALYRELRSLLHGGDVVRADVEDPATWLHGVVAPDRSRAVFSWVRLATSVDARPGRVRLPGLDAGRTYRVRWRDDLGAGISGVAPPRWMEGTEITLPGAVLGGAGLSMPITDPGTAVLLTVDAVER